MPILSNTDNLRKRIAYNTIVQFGGKALSTILGIAGIAMITRHLGASGFGEYTSVINFLSIFGIIADLGLTLVTVQMLCRPGVDEAKMLANLLGLRLSSALIIIGSAPLFVLALPYSDAIKAGVFIASAIFVFAALNQILTGLFQKHLKTDRLALSEVFGRLVLLFSLYIAIKTDSGLKGILWANIASSAVHFFLLFILSKGINSISLRFDWPIWKDIFRQSWPLAITIGLNLVYLKADTLILSTLDRESSLGLMTETGLYGSAYRIVDVMITLPFIFSGLIMPVLSTAWQEGRKQDFQTTLQQSFNALTFVAWPLILGTPFVSKELMVLVAGAEFGAAGPILNLLIIAAAAIFIGNIPAHALIAIGQQKKAIAAYAFTAISSLGLYFLLIPHWSFYGAALGTIWSEVFIAISSIYLLKKYSQLKLDGRIPSKQFLSAIVMALVLFLVQHTFTKSIFLLLPLSVLVYIPLCIWLRIDPFRKTTSL